MNRRQLIEDWFPVARAEFRIDEIAKIFSCSIQHVHNLVKSNEIKVPAENIAKAQSAACILVPRESLVDFLNRRAINIAS
jgi:hypothetical protein